MTYYAIAENGVSFERKMQNHHGTPARYAAALERTRAIAVVGMMTGLAGALACTGCEDSCGGPSWSLRVQTQSSTPLKPGKYRVEAFDGLSFWACDAVLGTPGCADRELTVTQYSCASGVACPSFSIQLEGYRSVVAVQVFRDQTLLGKAQFKPEYSEERSHECVDYRGETNLSLSDP